MSLWQYQDAGDLEAPRTGGGVATLEPDLELPQHSMAVATGQSHQSLQDSPCTGVQDGETFRLAPQWRLEITKRSQGRPDQPQQDVQFLGKGLPLPTGGSKSPLLAACEVLTPESEASLGKSTVVQECKRSNGKRRWDKLQDCNSVIELESNEKQ